MALVPFSSKVAAAEQNSQSSSAPLGAPSTLVTNIQSQFPALHRLSAVVILYRRSGVTTGDLAYARATQGRVEAFRIAGQTKVTALLVAPNHGGVIIEVSLSGNASAGLLLAATLTAVGVLWLVALTELSFLVAVGAKPGVPQADRSIVAFGAAGAGG